MAPDGFLYGLLPRGGIHEYGAIYRVDRATGTRTTVASFTGKNSNPDRGSFPTGGLRSDEAGNLIGVCTSGGKNDYGTVYKFNLSSKTITTLADFSDATGRTTEGFLTSDGYGNFWGTTYYGGTSDYGTVYRINAATGSIVTVVQFTGNGQTRGKYPTYGLTNDGFGYMWGATAYGGSTEDRGTLFKIRISSGAVTTVHDFRNDPTPQGYAPVGALVADGNGFLWGATRHGSSSGSAVFKIHAQTHEFTVLNASIDNRISPSNGLTSDGAGSFWGPSSSSIYKVDAATGVIAHVVNFDGSTGIDEGKTPTSALINDGEGYLWGIASQGGLSNDGNIFRIEIATGTLTTVCQLADPDKLHLGSRPSGGLIGDQTGRLWGTTAEGGTYDYGTIYTFDPATGTLTTVVEFTGNGGTKPGAYPYGELIDDGQGYLWGTTVNGGTNNYGTVYKVNIATGQHELIVEFSGTGGACPGKYPQCGLTKDETGNLWGTTRLGGTADIGTLFKIEPLTRQFASLLNFSTNTTLGGHPQIALTSDGAGNLWGTTPWVSQGVNQTPIYPKLFKYNIATSSFTLEGNLSTFSPTLTFGQLYYDGNGFLWGLTTSSSNSSIPFSSIFKIATATGVLTTVYSPSYQVGPQGRSPLAGLVDDGQGNLWGTTQSFGTTSSFYGTVFRFNTATKQAYTQLECSETATSGYPSRPGYAKLFPSVDGKLYGVMQSRGTTTKDTFIDGGLIYRITPDSETEAPTVISPVADRSYGLNIPLKVELPEDSHWLKLTFDDGNGTSRTKTYNWQEAGVRQLTVQPKNASFSTTLDGIADSTLPDGLYDVTFRYSDACGNGYATVIVGKVRIDTERPILSLPDNITQEATSASGAIVTYTASGSDAASGVASGTFVPASGSNFPLGATTVTARVTDNAGNIATGTFTVTVSDSTPPTISVGDHTTEVVAASATQVNYPAAVVSDLVEVAEVTYSQNSGTGFPFGNTTVTVTAKDKAGNSSTSTFTVKVQDTVAPIVTIPSLVLPTDASGTAALPDWRFDLNVTDVMGTPTRSQTPAPGTPLSIGNHSIAFTVSDTSGNTTTKQGLVSVRFGSVADPESTIGALTGTSAPTTTGLDPSTTLANFFPPAISDQRHLAAKVTLKSGRSLLNAVYQQDFTGAAQLRAFQNQAVPLLSGATFKSFGDPILSGDGSVAFAAKLQGKNVVTNGTDDTVWTDALGGGLRLVLREGHEVLDGLKLKVVSSFSLRDGELLALATLQTAKNQVTSADDTVVLRITASGPEILLREGASITAGTPAKTSKVKTISILGPALGSPGHGRWQAEGATLAKVTLADGRTVILRLVSGEDPTPILATQTAAEELELTAKWTKFGLPAIGSAGVGYAVQGTLQSLRGEVASTDDAALLYSEDGETFSELIRENDPAFDIGGPVFASFLDPVVNADGEALFQGTLRGTGATTKNKIGLWRGFPGDLELAVRLGDTATDKDGDEVAGRTFTAFVSHALPDGLGPLFLAKVAGTGVKSTSNLGLWSQGADGQIRELIRTGDEIPLSDEPGAEVRTVKTLTVLTSQAGVFGATRSFNSTGSVAVLVTFTDKSQAILRLDLP